MKKEKGDNAAIGRLMRQVRELRGMNQTELARALKTSQSAVARMEQGGQNFGTALLEKISKVLGRKMVSISSNMDFSITGGTPLHGEVTINRSKNGAMGLLAASLLNQGTTILHGIPRVEETARMRELLSSLGVSVRDLGGSSFEIKVPKEISLQNTDVAAATKMRSTLMLLGGLAVSKMGKKKFTMPNAGGCIMGNRSSIAHVRGLEALGIAISELTTKRTAGGLRVDASARHAGEVVMYEMSDTATENVLIAAAGIPGATTIRFAASNYMVQDVAHFLRALGVGVLGIGTATLTVNGLDAGTGAINRTIEYWNSEDPTEAMFFLSIAATTRSHLLLRRCPIDFLQLELAHLSDMGLRFKMSKRYKSDNGVTDLVDIEVFSSTAKSPLTAPAVKIHAQPYPGINTDNLPFFVPIATQAVGTTLIHDWMWENRAIYFTEMNRLGAKVLLADPHRVFVEGPTPLTGAQIVCPPALRPATIILVGMLAAHGTSILRNVYSINRGYEDVVARLNRLGAKIEILS
jgi:UDP-N-acetylglucosamine 1-carboxyvinyltransferase